MSVRRFCACRNRNLPTPLSFLLEVDLVHGALHTDTQGHRGSYFTSGARPAGLLKVAQAPAGSRLAVGPFLLRRHGLQGGVHGGGGGARGHHKLWRRRCESNWTALDDMGWVPCEFRLCRPGDIGVTCMRATWSLQLQ